MEQSARRAAIAAWKESPVDAGIYAFRQEGGPVWVGASPRLGAVENRLRFVLRTGGPAPKALVTAWAAVGGEGFQFEVLEQLDPKLSQMARARLLKERLEDWRDRLAAEAI